MQDEDVDADLLQAWLSGSPAAGATLFDRYAGLLRAYFRREGESEAEDLVQRTLLAGIEAAPAFRGGSSFRGYLMRIARYQLYARYRERTRERRVARMWTDPHDEADEGHKTERAEEHTERATQSLASALANLPADLREVVTTVYHGGYTQAQTALLLGIPPGTVASRLRRAREQLRGAIAWPS